MRDFRIGDRVMTPLGVEYVVSVRDGTVCTHGGDDAHRWDPCDVDVIDKPGIQREHLSDLYLAANKQLVVLQREGEERARVELAHFAEALRVLLEGEVRDGE